MPFFTICENNGSTDLSLNLLIALFSPPINMGTTQAISNSFGIYPCTNDLLISSDSVYDKMSLIFLRSQDKMLLTQCLEFLSPPIMLLISHGTTGCR